MNADNRVLYSYNTTIIYFKLWREKKIKNENIRSMRTLFGRCLPFQCPQQIIYFNSCFFLSIQFACTFSITISKRKIQNANEFKKLYKSEIKLNLWDTLYCFRFSSKLSANFWYFLFDTLYTFICLCSVQLHVCSNIIYAVRKSHKINTWEMCHVVNAPNLIYFVW